MGTKACTLGISSVRRTTSGEKGRFALLHALAHIELNAIDLALSLGMEPRVGVLSAVETVNPAIQSSMDAALLSKMADRGQIKGGLVEGPLAMDNAVDMGAARTKGLCGGVAGRAGGA